MKTRLGISMISVLTIAIAGLSVCAQSGYGDKHWRGHGVGYPDSCHIQLMVDDMKKALDLSEKQVDQIEQIHYAHIAEVKELKTEYQDDCVAVRDARIAMRDKVHADVKAVMNDEQQLKFDEFIAERMGPHGHHAHHGHHGSYKK